MIFRKKITEIHSSNEDIHLALEELRQEINSVVVMLAEKDDQVRDLSNERKHLHDVLTHYRDVMKGLSMVIRSPERYLHAPTGFFTLSYYDDHLRDYPDDTSVLTLKASPITSLSELVLDFCQDHHGQPVLWSDDVVKIFLYGVKPLARDQITSLLREWDGVVVANHRLKVNDGDLP